MLSDTIRADTTLAMKAGDPLRLSVLRMLTSELNYKKIDVQRELTDEDVLSVLGKEVKKRREAIEAYQKAGRNETAAKEAQELTILQTYMPVQMTEEEVRAQLESMTELVGLTEFGQVMRIVSPVFKGKADGSLVARLVKERLEQ